MAARANVKRTLSPLNNHENFTSFGGAHIRTSEVMLNQNFTDVFLNVVHVADGGLMQTTSTITVGVVNNLDVGVVGVTNVDSHNRYPLSFFYIYYTLEFEKSQVNKL